jgi:serine/threonine protein kinase
VPLARLRDDGAPALITIVERCMQRSPADRYQTAGELRDALVACSV